MSLLPSQTQTQDLADAQIVSGEASRSLSRADGGDLLDGIDALRTQGIAVVGSLPG